MRLFICSIQFYGSLRTLEIHHTFTSIHIFTYIHNIYIYIDSISYAMCCPDLLLVGESVISTCVLAIQMPSH